MWGAFSSMWHPVHRDGRGLCMWGSGRTGRERWHQDQRRNTDSFVDGYNEKKTFCLLSSSMQRKKNSQSRWLLLANSCNREDVGSYLSWNTARLPEAQTPVSVLMQGGWQLSTASCLLGQPERILGPAQAGLTRHFYFYVYHDYNLICFRFWETGYTTR